MEVKLSTLTFFKTSHCFESNNKDASQASQVKLQRHNTGFASTKFMQHLSPNSPPIMFGKNRTREKEKELTGMSAFRAGRRCCVTVIAVFVTFLCTALT